MNIVTNHVCSDRLSLNRVSFLVSFYVCYPVWSLTLSTTEVSYSCVDDPLHVWYPLTETTTRYNTPPSYLSCQNLLPIVGMSLKKSFDELLFVDKNTEWSTDHYTGSQEEQKSLLNYQSFMDCSLFTGKENIKDVKDWVKSNWWPLVILLIFIVSKLRWNYPRQNVIQ